MREYQYFKQSSDPDISAALVGISRIDWIYNEPGESKRDAVRKMRTGEFDVLPVMNKNRAYVSYFHTAEWGRYDEQNIGSSRISGDDHIYYLTHIKDVIRSFHTENRNFFFLTNRIEVIGLITIGNLNCKHVSLYYFNLLSNLERRLAQFIKAKLERDEILTNLEKIAVQRKIETTLKAIESFRADNKIGMDSNIIEYLYLSDLFLLIEEKNLFELLGYGNKEDVVQHTGKLKKLRNSIAHPTRSLVSSRESISELWQASEKIEDLDVRLDGFIQ